MATLEEEERAKQLKRKMFRDQGGCCYFCKKPFKERSHSQLAHRITQSKYNLKTYGKDIIHHRLNFRLTCDKCNVKATVSLQKNSGKMLLEEIAEELSRGLG